MNGFSMLFTCFKGDLAFSRVCGLGRGERGGTWGNVVLMLKRGEGTWMGRGGTWRERC